MVSHQSNRIKTKSLTDKQQLFDTVVWLTGRSCRWMNISVRMIIPLSACHRVTTVAMWNHNNLRASDLHVEKPTHWRRLTVLLMWGFRLLGFSPFNSRARHAENKVHYFRTATVLCIVGLAQPKTVVIGWRKPSQEKTNKTVSQLHASNRGEMMQYSLPFIHTDVYKWICLGVGLRWLVRLMFLSYRWLSL